MNMNYRFRLFAATLVVLLVLAAQLVPHFASAQANRITNVIIEVDRQNYSGPCPMEIRLKGRLITEGPLGVIRYQFVHSDGTPSAASQLTIDHKGEFTIVETLRKNANWNDTIYLSVLTAVPLNSNRIPIKGECQRPASNSAGPARQPFPGYLRRSSFRPDNRANINRYLLSDGDVIMMTVEEDPGIAANQIEIVLKTDPNVTWWKSINVSQGITPDDSWHGVRTVNSISTQDDDHGPKAMRLNFA